MKLTLAPALDAVDQHGGELVQFTLRDRSTERDDFGCFVHAARSSFDATVASAFNR